MRKVKFILIVLVLSWSVLLIVFVCYPKEQPTFTEQFISLQEQAGTEPDGLLGPDSIKCIRAKLQSDLFNSYARPYVTGEAYK